MGATLPNWPERPLDLNLIGNLWRHYSMGEELKTGFNLDGFNRITGNGISEYAITRERFEDALLTHDALSDAISGAGITLDQAWGYLEVMAPWAVRIIGNSGWPPQTENIGAGP